ncbi:DUF4174 domain-containing protein [Winogradskyella jejuensis]|uniref:DUF4174 domain-containing protein n=1 Tax=Winogradskyella jejuensis TaxID=1089305 RepID=A0A1M5PEE8_9FLAO|nr:DUF4174 domain-containing protein [Winogradskyella jejuensis]SHG99623.1 protein of unknown function [Winogradskyella jejuensis]
MKYVVLTLLFSSCLFAQDTNAHLWKERVIIISGNEAARDTIDAQFHRFESQLKELRDRKLVIYRCINKFCVYYDSKSKPKMFNREETSENFSISLFGLDGGKKFSSTEVIESNVIFNLVDSMPMRRQELRNKQN